MAAPATMPPSPAMSAGRWRWRSRRSARATTRGCIDALQRDPRIANRFGGSHAQRDVLDLTLMEAALRLPDPALARAISAERRAMKPDSPHAHSLFDQARALPTA